MRKKIFNKIKKIIKRIKYNLCAIVYIKYYEKIGINSKMVLAQAYAGMNFYGNIYYIVKEFISREECKDFKFFIGVRKKDYRKTKKFIKNKFGNKVNVVTIGRIKYLKILASSKFLLNNVDFPPYFIKKQGQVYLNTWHGTPFKGLGRGIIDAPNESGNKQRNFLMADYLLFPSEYAFNCMREEYMISNLYNGKYLLCGYPRNAIFFDNKFKKDLRRKYNIEEKEVLIYMPTWRRQCKKGQEDIQINKCIEFLDYLEQNLQENQIVYVKLHNLVNDLIVFNKYKKIKEFPKDCETYELVAASDALITDYSSVMFDYINCNKKIILYAYDLQDYINTRGIYFDINTLPFPICNTKDEVLQEIKNINVFSNYKNVQDKFCPYDNIDATKEVVDLLLKLKETNIQVIKGNKYHNNKSNILIYCGDLADNEQTEDLVKSLNYLPNKFNWYLNFYDTELEKNKFIINKFPKEIFYITLQGALTFSFKEVVCYILYYKLNIKNKIVINNLNNLFIREIKRLYLDIDFEVLIDSKYNTQIINMHSLMNGKKYLFIDMSKKIKSIENKTLKLRNKNFDKIIDIPFKGNLNIFIKNILGK